jgi:Ca2+-binding EF-hand superfamily protein
VHFQNADNWRQGDDVGNNKLNFEEFRLASKTFTAAQAHENQTEQQMIDDFRLLDVDDDGYVDFFEVCQCQRMQCAYNHNVTPTN